MSKITQRTIFSCTRFNKRNIKNSSAEGNHSHKNFIKLSNILVHVTTLKKVQKNVEAKIKNVRSVSELILLINVSL